MDLGKVLNEWVIGGIVILLAILIAWSLYVKTEPASNSQHHIEVDAQPNKAIYWQPSQHDLEPWRRD